MEKIQRTTSPLKTKFDLKSMEFERKFDKRDKNNNSKSRKSFREMVKKNNVSDQQVEEEAEDTVLDDYIDANITISEAQRSMMMSRIKCKINELESTKSNLQDGKNDIREDEEKE